MNAKITKIHRADAFYSDKEKVIGTVVQIESTEEWTKKDEYKVDGKLASPAGFSALYGKVTFCPSGHFQHGEYVIFHAVKFEEAVK